VAAIVAASGNAGLVNSAAPLTGGFGTRLPRAERRAQLVAAATAVFAEKGYAAASLRDVAERVGIFKQSLYYYVDSKEDLLHQVLRAAVDAGGRVVEQAVAAPGDPLCRFGLALRGYLGHLREDPDGVRVLLRETDSLPDPAGAGIRAAVGAHRAALAGLVEAAREAGLVRPDVVPELVVLHSLGALNWLPRWFSPRGELSPEQIAEQLVDVLIRGIAAPGIPIRNGRIPASEMLCSAPPSY
jgi:TetR/AcrR family transcriptional regulator, cholesterol catabolism regulator